MNKSKRPRWIVAGLTLGLGLALTALFAFAVPPVAATMGSAAPSPEAPLALAASTPLTAPLLSEGFEGGFPPEGWLATRLQPNGGWAATSAHAHTGDSSAFHDDVFGETDAWLVTPAFTPTEDSELRFWQHEEYPDYYSYHGIWVSTGRGDPKYGDFRPLADDIGPATTSGWEQITYTLGQYAGQPIYLAFRYRGNDFNDEWYIDDVEVTTGLVLHAPARVALNRPATMYAAIAEGRTATFHWNFGDGSPEITTTEATITHTYAAVGTYTVTVTAEDGVSALSDQATVEVCHFIYLPLVLRNR